MNIINDSIPIEMHNLKKPIIVLVIDGKTSCSGAKSAELHG